MITIKGMNRIITLFFCISFAIVGKAQVDVSTSQLAGIKWKKTSPVSKRETITMMFSETNFTDSIYYSSLNKTVGNSLSYYITDELPSFSVFHSDYVGKERTGCYIVMYYPKVNDVDYFTVVSFTDDELVLFHKAKPDPVPGLDMYIKYERIR